MTATTVTHEGRVTRRNREQFKPEPTQEELQAKAERRAKLLTALAATGVVVVGIGFLAGVNILLWQMAGAVLVALGWSTGVVAHFLMMLALGPIVGGVLGALFGLLSLPVRIVRGFMAA